MKKLLLAFLLSLAATAALAQVSTEPFGFYVNALTAATSVNAADQFYVRQSGVSKQVPFSSIIIPNANLASAPTDTLKCNNTNASATPADCVLFTLPYTGGIFSSGASPVANISRLDRLLVSTATINTGTNPDSGTEDWLETLITHTTSLAQLASISPQTGIAVLGAIRSSDVSANEGIGVYGFALNNEVGSTAFAYYGEAQDSTGSTHALFTTVMELDPVNFNSSLVSIDPFNINPTGVTTALWIASGGSHSGAFSASAAMVILKNNTTFQDGIVFQSGAINGASAILLPYNDEIDWFTAAGTLGGSLKSIATVGGIAVGVGSANTESVIFDNKSHIDTTGGLTPSLSGCGTSPTITGNDWAGRFTTGSTGTITSCVMTFAVAYNAAPFCLVVNQVAGGAPGITPTATTLTLATASNSETLVYYCFGQPGG